MQLMPPIIVSPDWDASSDARPGSRSSSQERRPRCGWCPKMKPIALGWKKWCLFILICVLIIMVIVNMALTLWMMTVMQFSYSGMGPLKISSGGIQLSGKSMVLDSLIASSIESRAGQPIVIQSDSNFTISTRLPGRVAESRMFVDKDNFECRSNLFKIYDTDGNMLFSANPQQVEIGAHTLKLTGAGGAVFPGSVQTPLVRAESGHDLKLESLTRSLNIDIAKDIKIESTAGNIEAISYSDIRFKSTDGSVILDSPKISLENLQIALPSYGKSSSNTKRVKIYQLCVCENGRLFLASPKGVCETYNSEFICR